MGRFLIFLAILFLIYFIFKRSISRFFGIGRPRASGQKKGPPITDELVQDPICKTYVPKKEALVYGKRGRLFYFCSKECLEKFKEKE